MPARFWSYCCVVVARASETGLPAETRREILASARSRDFRIALKVTLLKKQEDDEF